MSILLRNFNKIQSENNNQPLDDISGNNSVNEFSILEMDRRDWTVGRVENVAPISKIISNTFSKIIALGLHLELPVGSFLRALIEREEEIPPYAMPGIIKNILDEEKHYLAFQRLENVYPPNPLHLSQANNFRKELVSSKTHPLIKARDLETILFIPLQTYMRMYGSDSIERVIAHISHDEYRHLQYGWLLSEELGMGYDSEFETLVTKIANWVFEEIYNDKYDKNFWKGIIADMRDYGESKEISDIVSWGYALPLFEISNSNY